MPSTFTPNINVEKEELGDTSWQVSMNKFKDKVDELAMLEHLTVHYAGLAIDEEIFFDDFEFKFDVDIVACSIFCRVGPSGTALTIDFLKDGAEQSKTVTVSAGTDSIKQTITGLNYVGGGTPEKLGLKIKTIGSTEPGRELTVTIYYRPEAIT